MSTSSSSLYSSQLLSSAESTQEPQVNKPKKSPYQAAQQLEFLHLQAEVESLLQQLQFLKKQRVATTSFKE